MTATPATPTPDLTVRKGLEGVVAAETRIGHVDGERCQLIYRGYSIDELIGRTTYEEVSYLLLYGVLPTARQLAEWTRQLETHRTLAPKVDDCLQLLPHGADPMALLRTIISAIGLYDPDAETSATETLYRKAVRVIAATPTIIAAMGRMRQGLSPVAPREGLGHAANFLYMLHGREASESQTKALDAYFVLLAEHGLNASTFAARTVTGTQSDFYSAIVGAIGTLKGPLHGAANRRAMEMLIEIGSPERADDYVYKSLEDHKRFMGFGHRVYKGEDPRAKHLKAFALQLGEEAGELKWITIGERLIDAVQRVKQLSINVDFYSAPLLHYLSIPTELFTTMFACARMAGWAAHIIEQASDNRLIRPLSQYVGPRDLRVVPLAQRVTT